MADSVTINLKIAGDGSGGTAAVSQVVAALKQLGVTAETEGKKVEHAGQSAGEFGKQIREGFTGLAENLIGALGLSELGKLTFSMLDTAVAVGRLGQQTGVTTENLSALQLIAARNNVSLTEMGQGLTQLSRKLVEAQTAGSPAALAFQSLGLNAAALVKLPLDQVLQKVAAALNKYSDGAVKSDLITELFSLRSQRMLPILNALADDGLAKATTETEKLGTAIHDADVIAGQQFVDSLTSLKTQVDGLALKFGEALAPAIKTTVDELQRLTTAGSGTTSSLGVVGQAIGLIAKSILLVLTALATGIADIGSAISINITSDVAALKLAISGNLSGAAAELGSGFAKVKALIAENAADLAKTRDALFPDDDQKARNFIQAHRAAVADYLAAVKELQDAGKKVVVVPIDKLLGMTPDAVRAAMVKLQNAAKVPPSIPSKPGLDAEKLSKAQSAAAEAAFRDEIERVKTQSALLLAQATLTFDQGGSSLTQFFAARRQLLADAFAAELAAADQASIQLQKTADSAQTEPARIEAQAKADSAAAKVKQLAVQFQQQSISLTDEEIKGQLALNDAFASFQEKLAGLQGNNQLAAVLALNVETRKLSLSFAQLGLPLAVNVALLAQFRAASLEGIGAAKITSDVDRLATSLSNSQAALGNLVAGNAITEDDATLAQNRYAASVQGAVAALIDQARAQRAAATNPDVQLSLDALIIKLQGIQVAGHQATTALQLLGVRAADALSQSLPDDALQFLSDLTDETRTTGDAFKALGLSIVTTLQGVLKQLLAMELQKVLRNAVLGGGQSSFASVLSAGQVAGAIPTGVQVATGAASSAASSAAATAAGTSAGVAYASGAATALPAAEAAGTEAGIAFATAAASAAAATTTATEGINAILGFAAFAEGGAVSGSGTGDTVPAMLTPGEFVLSRQMVANLGPEFFDGLRTPTIRQYGAQRLAAGGFVQPAAGQRDMSIAMSVDAHPDLIVSQIRTRKGRQALHQFVSENRTTLRQTLGIK